MTKSSKKPSWTKARTDDPEDDIVETPLLQYDPSGQPIVANTCCKLPNLWIQKDLGDVVSLFFRVVCKHCRKKGEETDWSPAMAVALWNIDNPLFPNRDPLITASNIKNALSQHHPLSLQQSAELAQLLNSAAQQLRKLVLDAEEARIELILSLPSQ